MGRFKDIPETPGPGTYAIPEPASSPCNAEFGKAKARIKGARFYKIKCTPGPGSYTDRSQFGEFTAPSGGKQWQVASRYLDIVTKKVTEPKKKRKVKKSGGKKWQVASRYLDIVTKKVTGLKKKRKVKKRNKAKKHRGKKKRRKRPKKVTFSVIRKMNQRSK